MPAPTPSEVTVPANIDLGDWLNTHSVNDQLTIMYNGALIRITKKGAGSCDIEYLNECGEEETTKYRITIDGNNAIIDGTSYCSEDTPSSYEQALTDGLDELGYSILNLATNNNLKWYDVEGTFEY